MKKIPSEAEFDVGVVGAGIVGVCVALELVKRNLRVVIFDPAPVCSKTSYGNAGVISPWTCVPQSIPGLWKKIPSWLLTPTGPVYIRAKYFPKFLPWAIKFLSAGKGSKLEKIGNAMYYLSRGSVDAYKQLLVGTGKAHLVQDSLYVHVYRNKADASLNHLVWRMRQDRNIPIELVNKDDLTEIEPELSNEFGAAIIIKQQGRASDPAGIGVALAKQAILRGAVHVQNRVNFITPNTGNGCTVSTENGVYNTSKIVLAAGVWSPELLIHYGFRLPLEAERGYHLVIKDPNITINNSIMDADGKYVISSMEAGIRIAGTAEFAGLDAKPNYERARCFSEHAKDLFPRINCSQIEEWMGSRPSFPDSLPCLGEIPRLNGIIASFGHSHYGLGMAPGTARLIADCVTNKSNKADLSAYDIGRFL